LLGINVSYQKISLPEIRHIDISVAVKAKAEAAYKQLGRPVFVDDTGLYIHAWNNLPGFDSMVFKQYWQ